MTSLVSAVILCTCVVLCSGLGYDWNPRRSRFNNFRDPHYERPAYRRHHVSRPFRGHGSGYHNSGYQPVHRRRYRRAVTGYADPTAVHDVHHGHGQGQTQGHFPLDRFDNGRFPLDRFDNGRFPRDRFDNGRFPRDRFDNGHPGLGQSGYSKGQRRGSLFPRNFRGPFGTGGSTGKLFGDLYNKFQSRVRGRPGRRY